MTLARHDDRWKKPATILGFFIIVIFAAITLLLPTARQPSEGVKYALLALGCGLISPGFVIDLVRLWRGTSSPPEPPA